MKKRVISWLLTVVMVVSLLPTSVLADTLAADQEQQAQQEQIAPADTENTIPGDYNRVSVKEVESLMKGSGSGRVQR